MLDKNLKIELEEIISRARASVYNNNIDYYMYNIVVSESFYPALSILEVTLRNKISSAIDKLICKDWLLLELKKQNILADKEYKKLQEASLKIIKENKKVTNDRLISELTFGFWVHLCNKSYKPKLWDKKGFFELVFPNYVSNTALRKITTIQNDLRFVLKLRNRIFHHEIIINNKKSLEEQYKIIINLLQLLSITAVELLSKIDRSKDIIKQKPRRLC